jgi:hypothetical protein
VSLADWRRQRRQLAAAANVVAVLMVVTTICPTQCESTTLEMALPFNFPLLSMKEVALSVDRAVKAEMGRVKSSGQFVF